MALIQKQNQEIETMEIEQMRTMREMAISQVDDEILPFLEGIENITDPTEIFCKNIERYGFKSIMFVPTYNKIRKEIVYEPWYALKQLGLYLHHSEPDKLATTTLKNHITKSYKQIEEESATGSRPRSNIIVPDVLQIKELGQVNFTNFDGAKYLVNQIATDARYKNNSGRPIAKQMLKCLEQVSIISRDLLIVLNRIVSEYRYKDQQKELEEYRTAQQRANAVDEEAKLRATTMASQFRIRDMRRDTLYLVTTPTLERIGVFKIGITTNWDQRIGQYRTHNVEIKECYRLQIENVDLVEKQLIDLFKINGLIYYHNPDFKDVKFKNSEWVSFSNLQLAIKIMDHVSEANVTTHEIIKEIITDNRNRLLIGAGIDPDIMPLMIENEPDTEPEDIKKRVINRFIEEKLHEDIELKYGKLSDFKKDFSRILKYFKRDEKFAELPNEINDVLKLFEDDERVIFEVKKKGNTKTVRMTTKLPATA